MSKEKAPAFQFYPKDLLSDINWIMMNYVERGMYWQLVSICWLEGSIPSDIAAIAKILQVDVCAVEDAWRQIGKCFIADPCDCHCLLHKRLEKERQNQRIYASQKARAGLIGAEKRWGKRKKTKDKIAGAFSANSKTIANDSSSSASPSPNISLPSEESLLKNFIVSEYEKERGCKLITDKTDWIQFSALIKTCNGSIQYEKLKEAWTLYLKSTDEFHQKQGHPLRWWCSNINAFLGDKPKATKSIKQKEDETFWSQLENKYGK